MFTRACGTAGLYLWTVQLDGTDATRVTRRSLDGGHDEVSPSWSPNGRRIAFQDRGALFTITPDGTGRTKIREAANFYGLDWQAR